MKLIPSLVLLAALATAEEHAPKQLSQDDPRATVTGRFLLPDGSAASSVAIKLHGWVSGQERKIEYGLPDNWSDLATTADADGRFELRFDPPQAFQFTLDCKLARHAEASWRWGRLRPGEVMDLGDVSLAEAGTIVGRVVDSGGEVPSGFWMVYADSSLEQEGPGGDRTRVMAPADPRTGEFRLEGLPPGRVELKAHSQIANWVDGPTVRVRANEVTEAEIVYDGPDNRRRIVVIPFSDPFYTHDPAPESIKLIAADGTERTAVHVEGSSQSEAFDDLPDGLYRVEIDDPLFEFWSRDRVRPGRRVEARLTGAATIELEVVDGETGHPIPRYGLRVVFHGPQGSPTGFELLSDNSIPPAKGVFSGILATPLRLIVRLEGRSVHQVEVEDLMRGDRRSLRVEVNRATRLVGRVLDAAGVPLAGVEVQRTTGTVAGLPKNVTGYGRSGPRRNLDETYETDRDGRFVATGGAVGMQTFRVSLGPWVSVDRTVELPLDDGESFELQMPPSGWLEGQLALPDGVSSKGLSLSFVGSGFDRVYSAVDGGSIQADGRFRYGPLPTGWAGVYADISCELPDGGFDGHQQWIGFTKIEPDSTTNRSWDLRLTYPGSAHVTLRIDGELFAKASLLFDLETTRYLGMFSSATESGRSVAYPRPGVDGIRARGGLMPGTWLVRVISLEHRWQWTSPEPIQIKPGQATQVAISLDLVRSYVRFVDAESGDPYTNGEVVVWTGIRGEESSSMLIKTDADCGYEFLLPPGSVRFSRQRPRSGSHESARGRFTQDQEPDDSVAVEWKVGNRDPIVRLPRREK